MIEYCLNDILSESDLKNFEDFNWIVHNYENGTYDGVGYAVALKDTTLYVYNLGHCSCYGPFDDGSQGFINSFSVQDFLTSEDIFVGRIDDEKVRNKVKEVLQ